MKTLLLILTILYSQVSIAAEKVKVHVPAMVCQMCVFGMKNSFRDAVVDEDKDILVDLDSKIVTLNLKNDLTAEEIKKRVADAGYEVSKIERLPTKKTSK